MTKEKYIKPCKITDELYCIGVSGNPSHIITTSEGIVMIDTGCPDAFETLKHSKNMMFDFCANTLPEATEKCIEAVGPQRLLFGTDMPIAKMRMYRIVENGYYVNVVPKGFYGDLTGAAHMREVEDYSQITNFTYEVIRGFKKTAEKLSLSKKDIEDVFFNNAAKLYNYKG